MINIVRYSIRHMPMGFGELNMIPLCGLGSQAVAIQATTV